MLRVIGALFFVLSVIPAIAQTEESVKDRHKGIAYAIQSFGWKCNEVQNFEGTHFTAGKYVWKISCGWGQTYYVRNTHAGSGFYDVTICTHKGKCRKFE